MLDPWMQEQMLIDGILYYWNFFFWEYEKAKWVKKKCWELLIQVMKVNFLECLSDKNKTYFFWGSWWVMTHVTHWITSSISKGVEEYQKPYVNGEEQTCLELFNCYFEIGSNKIWLSFCKIFTFISFSTFYSSNFM